MSRYLWIFWFSKRSCLGLLRWSGWGSSCKQGRSWGAPSLGRRNCARDWPCTTDCPQQASCAPELPSSALHWSSSCRLDAWWERGRCASGWRSRGKWPGLIASWKSRTRSKQSRKPVNWKTIAALRSLHTFAESDWQVSNFPVWFHSSSAEMIHLPASYLPWYLPPPVCKFSPTPAPSTQ